MGTEWAEVGNGPRGGQDRSGAAHVLQTTAHGLPALELHVVSVVSQSEGLESPLDLQHGPGTRELILGEVS